MKRVSLVVLCLLLLLPAAPALAKKHKKKSKPLGPVVTATATGNTTTTQGQDSTATAVCPSGKQAVGGGFTVPVVSGSALIVHDSYRSAANTWTVAGQNANGTGAVIAHVYCRNPSRTVGDVSASTTLNSTGEIKTLSPACPTGQRLIGGGFQSTVPPAADAVVFPQVNQATSPSTWTVTGVENQDGAITLTAHAYCMTKIAAPVLIAATGSGNGGLFAGAASTTPSCPVPKKQKKPKKGKKRKKKPRKLLSAGGFSVEPVNGTEGAPVPVPGESHIAQTGWLASAVNGVGTSATFSVTSQGICF